jgi:hypothetical protein
MDPTQFDRLSRWVANRPLTRRRTLAAASSALAGLVGTRSGTRAQATPTATPSATGTGLAANNSTLFVQTATGGTFRPNPQASATPVTVGRGTPAPVTAAHGAYLLTLQGHSGETIAFSDRPARQFGEVKTSQFFPSMGFTPANPPNAALVVDSPQQEDDVLLVELLNPGYDAATQTLTYEANILTQYTGEVLKPLAAQQQDQRIAATFTTASLFIDDCPDRLIGCYVYGSNFYNYGHLPGYRGMCWDWNQFQCLPCDGLTALSRECNAYFEVCRLRPETPCHAEVCYTPSACS